MEGSVRGLAAIGYGVGQVVQLGLHGLRLASDAPAWSFLTFWTVPDADSFAFTGRKRVRRVESADSGEGGGADGRVAVTSLEDRQRRTADSICCFGHVKIDGGTRLTTGGTCDVDHGEPNGLALADI